jgi:hypothetical protein
MVFFADCAVVPAPDVNQLADIAIATADSYASLTGDTPRVAMLSFSTKGSAKHADIDKVTAATAAAKAKRPGLIVDGELQGDAALIPAIGERKAKGSPVAGKANVLIFPDLDGQHQLQAGRTAGQGGGRGSHLAGHGQAVIRSLARLQSCRCAQRDRHQRRAGSVRAEAVVPRRKS